MFRTTNGASVSNTFDPAAVGNAPTLGALRMRGFAPVPHQNSPASRQPNQFMRYGGGGDGAASVATKQQPIEQHRQQRSVACTWTDHTGAPLSGTKWIHEAYRRGYILRVRDYAQLVPNQILFVVPVDYACFSRSEGSNKYDYGVLSAAEFFGPFVTVVVVSGKALLNEPYGALDRQAMQHNAQGRVELRILDTPTVVPNCDLVVEWDPPREGLLLEFPHVILADSDRNQELPEVMGKPGTPDGPLETSWIAEAGFPDWWLTNGSGDGWTRYMLWENVVRMPPVYERDLNDDSDEANAIFDAENRAEERLLQQLRAGRANRTNAGSLRAPK